MPDQPDFAHVSGLVPVPKQGRVFAANARVRLGDVLPSGRLRLDALVRHTQEISNDDTNDAGLEDGLAWIARSTTVEVHRPAELEEQLEFLTFCGGIGPRWAERRLSVTGTAGARYEVSTMWVSVDPTTGRPRKVSPQFHELYGTAASNRRVSARLTIPSEPGGPESPWPSRTSDFDTFDHMNNAVYWCTVEEVLAQQSAPARSVTLEYHAGIPPAAEVSYRLDSEAGGDHLMWWLADGVVAAAARIRLG